MSDARLRLAVGLFVLIVGLFAPSLGAQAPKLSVETSPLLGRFESADKVVRLHLRRKDGLIGGVLVVNGQSYEASAVKSGDGLAGEFGVGFNTWPFALVGDGARATLTARKVVTELKRRPLVLQPGIYRSPRATLQLSRRGAIHDGVLKIGKDEQAFTARIDQDVFMVEPKPGAVFGTFLLVDTDVAGQLEVRAGALRETLTFEPPVEVNAPRRIADLLMTLKWVPEGNFSMGSTNGYANEQPVTRVEVGRGFWMSISEVTQAQWETIMKTTFVQQREKASQLGDGAYAYGTSYPMCCVSWDEAVEFCRRLTTREREAKRLPEGYVYALPTEAQWEYVCRAGTTGDYAGRIDRLARYKKTSNLETASTTRGLDANAWGFYDMHGNVAEWCDSWLSARLPGGTVDEFAGAATGTQRVARGGSADQEAWRCRSAFRLGVPPATRTMQIGFRVVLTRPAAAKAAP